MASKWVSEDVWRMALNGSRRMVREYETHVFYNKRWELDEAYTKRLAAKERLRWDRIFATGEPEWQERYRAQRP